MYGEFQRPRKSLKYAFYLMMFVLALRLHIEIYHSIVGKTLEK